jgi:hypothetical protein
VSSGVPIAKAGDFYLYEDDLQGLIAESVNKEDSSRLADKYTQEWIKKQLMISRAEEEINLNEAEIERRLLDYRYALIVHEFEKFYIDAHLDENVGDDEILNYYNEKSDNFLLKQNIIKCLYIQVPKSSPNLNTLRRNVRNYPQTNKEDIREYCYQYAIKSYLEDSSWVNFEEVIYNTPLKNVDNKIQFLENTTYSETTDEDYIYFLRILDFKISDEISPLEFIRDDIENIIINKRKLALKQELEKAIYDEAVKNNEIEIYR